MTGCSTATRLLVLLTATAWVGPALSADSSVPRLRPKLDATSLSREIDRQVQHRLDQAKIEASGTSEDAEFLRRLFLDLHGVIPPVDRVIAFLDGKDPDRRAKLIDELLASPRYGQYQADLWDSILYRVILEKRYSPPREPFVEWLETAFNSNMRWDRQARELITASGNVMKNGTVAYLVHTKGVRSLEEVTNLTARVFLGRADIKCAQCHNHPFLSLKRDDYWGLAAFFSQLEVVRDGTAKGVKNGNLGLGDRLGPPAQRKGDVPDGFKVVPPRFLDGEQPKLGPRSSFRPISPGPVC
jgi:hypothetical protein